MCSIAERVVSFCFSSFVWRFGAPFEKAFGEAVDLQRFRPWRATAFDRHTHKVLSWFSDRKIMRHQENCAMSFGCHL